MPRAIFIPGAAAVLPPFFNKYYRDPLLGYQVSLLDVAGTANDLGRAVCKWGRAVPRVICCFHFLKSHAENAFNVNFCFRPVLFGALLASSLSQRRVLDCWIDKLEFITSHLFRVSQVEAISDNHWMIPSLPFECLEAA